MDLEGQATIKEVVIDEGIKPEQLTGKGIIRFKLKDKPMEAVMEFKPIDSERLENLDLRLITMTHFDGEILEQ